MDLRNGKPLELEAHAGPNHSRVQDRRDLVEGRGRRVGHPDGRDRAGVGQVEDVELQRSRAEAAELDRLVAAQVENLDRRIRGSP